MRSPMLWTMLHGFLWLVPLAAFCVIIPRFELIFADYGLDLPGSAVWVIRFSHMVTNLLPVVVLVLLAFLAVDFAAIRRFASSPEGRKPGRMWIGLMTLLPLLFTGFIAIAIGLPWWAYLSNRHSLVG